jgi:ATP-dependent Clp protease ATP-binding subunit ClpB
MGIIPKLIGPPGVGKTAILEGLASRIVRKEVSEVRLKNSTISCQVIAVLLDG